MWLLCKEEGLQRSVEGRAASDEEEEERSVDEGQLCLLEVKRLINRLHNCAKGYVSSKQINLFFCPSWWQHKLYLGSFNRCQKTAICHWLVSQSSAHCTELRGSPGLREIRGRVWIPGADEDRNESLRVRVKQTLKRY